MQEPVIEQALIDQFEEDGVVLIKGDGEASFFNDYCNWDRIPEYRSFIFHSSAAAVAAQLTGSSSIRLFHEHVVLKEAGTTVETPWHQDQPYYCVNGDIMDAPEFPLAWPTANKGQ